jgi:hypothetical protein
MNTSVQKRKPFKPEGPGPWLARIVNHLDKTYMGGLEVSIIKGSAGSFSYVSEPIPVRYMSPFFGVTAQEYQGGDPKNFNNVQKSYGMWMVPPDIGTTVMVIFIGGDYTQGYWIGCIPEKFQNRMVPGLAAETLPATALSQGMLDKYGTTTLPVAESLQVKDSAKANILSSGSAPGGLENYPAVHPFANRLAQQGLLKDTVRGVTSSSARREVPSKVFGISTPGPLDPAGPKFPLTYEGKTSKVTIPVSRLGGSTFVMDDGDQDGNNELVRIRTRTGHQILLHNTKKLIYIANGEGTSWIEMTERGKIDIFAQDSVSIHSEGDFNFRADRDVNIEAGQNINLHAFQNIALDSKKNIDIKAKQNFSTFAEQKIYLQSASDTTITSRSKLLMTAVQTAQLWSTDADIKIRANTKLDLVSADEVRTDGKKITTYTGKAASTKPDTPSSSIPTGVLLKGIKLTSAGSMSSFLNRVPMHEPWAQHETNFAGGLPISATSSSPTAQGGSANASDAQAENSANLVTDIAVIKKDINAALTAAKEAGAIVFTARSGSEERFKSSATGLQAAVIAGASYYKKNYGKPVIVSSTKRTREEQQALYDAWVAGGGSATNQTVYTPEYGNVTTPIDPRGAGWPNSHSKGLAADINPDAAEILYSIGFWNQVGVVWGGTWAKPDRVHIQINTTVGE